MRVRILFSLLVFVILFSVSASAFSLSPGSYKFEYDEINGLSEEFSFALRSTSSVPIVLSVGVGDDLADFVEVDFDEVSLKPRETKQVNVKLDIPPNLDKVGVREVRITFTKKVQDSGGFMAVTTALRARVLVTFAYPGEYITIVGLNPVNVNQGEDTVVNWEVQARGMATTSFVNSLFVFDSDGDVVFSKIFPKMFLERNNRYGESTIVPSGNFFPGDYEVFLSSVSADNSVNESRILRIGEEDIRLVDFKPSNFSVGDIVMFSFIVENLWNGEFSNVYGVLDFNGTSSTTKSMRLGAFGKVEIDRQYIDLSGFEEGVHNGSLTVFFDDYHKEFDVEIVALNPDSFSFFDSVVWVSVLVVVLLFVLVFLVILFRKSNSIAKSNKKVR